MGQQYLENAFRKAFGGQLNVSIAWELRLSRIFDAYQGQAVCSPADDDIPVEQEFQTGLFLQILESRYRIVLLFRGIIGITAVVVVPHYGIDSIRCLQPVQLLRELDELFRINVDDVSGEDYEVRPAGIDAVNYFPYLLRGIAVCAYVQVGDLGDAVSPE